MPDLGRLGQRVVRLNLNAVVLKLPDDVDDLGVADVGAVLLEGEPQHGDHGAEDVVAGVDHLADGALGHEPADAIVDATAGQDHLGDVADLLGLVGQVVGVYADAVTTNQAGSEGEEVPLGAGRLQHVRGVDVEPVEDQGQLVHQGDVQVPLGILDDLGGLGHLDGGRPVHPGGDHRFVHPCHHVQGGSVGTGHHLLDLGEAMLPVARVDPLRAVPHGEVPAAGEPRDPFQHRHALLLGHTRVDGGLVHHDVSLLQGAAHGLRCPEQEREVGPVGVVHRGGDRHDVEVGGREVGDGVGEQQIGRCQFLG